MNIESVYWLWLAKTLGAGAKTADIINYFGSARMLYERAVANGGFRVYLRRHR